MTSDLQPRPPVGQSRDDLAQHGTDGPVRPPLAPRDLLVARLAGIRAWQDALDAAVAAAGAPGLSRELRLDAGRELRVRQREQQALRERVCSARGPSGPVAVLVHRHTWTRQGLARSLTSQELIVVDVGDDGAAAVGTCVAEQPRVLVLDDTLAMRSGVEVVREVRRFSPSTLLVGHVSRSEAVGALLEAGAHLVLTRSVRPDDVAAHVRSLLGSAPVPGA